MLRYKKLLPTSIALLILIIGCLFACSPGAEMVKLQDFNNTIIETTEEPATTKAVKATTTTEIKETTTSKKQETTTTQATTTQQETTTTIKTTTTEQATTTEQTTTTEIATTTEQATTTETAAVVQSEETGSCIGNKNSKIYHYPDCGSVKKMKDKNKVYFNSFEEARAAGYRPCKNCNPPG